MDGVIVDFQSGIDSLTAQDLEKYHGKYAQCPDIFSKMVPLKGALEALATLHREYDVYILSSPSWGNSSAWSDKHDWVIKYLPFMKRRLILSSHKQLNIGDFLVDDRLLRGAAEFTGEHIHFGQDKFPDWKAVLLYLLPSN